MKLRISITVDDKIFGTGAILDTDNKETLVDLDFMDDYLKRWFSSIRRDTLINIYGEDKFHEWASK